MCIRDSVWTDNKRRQNERISTYDILHKYGPDYKIVFVGDAAMSPYEITYQGGSVEHFNEEAGAIWMKRITDKFPHLIWINPTAEQYWEYSQSTQIMRQLIGPSRMFPMTIAGLDGAMKELSR